jgi:muramidase (phage lysozyme)
MDRTVPPGAAHLLDFIRRTEVGRDDRASYDIIYGHNQGKLPKPVTSMTVDEVIAAQSGFTKRFGSSATGAYQFMKATLSDLKRELGLRSGQILDPDLQDRLGYHLLKRRGYEAFMAGQIDRPEFGKRLAMEWASFPVLTATQGAHRKLKRGQSYYAGDGVNKALVAPEKLEAVIDQAKALGNEVVVPLPLPKPEPAEVIEPEIIAPVPTACPTCGAPSGQVVVMREAAAPAEKVPTPVEQSSKAFGAGKWAVAASALWGAVVASGYLPPQFSTPEFTAVVGGVISTVAAAIGAYRAPPNAPTTR